ncbi:MAG TPA: Holliday junction resolvase RuvX [Bryobacteraceae bacterium]|jgi:putative Holliday junction resolvase|nr:Holliday junction resolvase RuvX [Bryobacteraceae bacterium]
MVRVENSNPDEVRISLNRVMALDLGKRRIGLAVSDPLGITAQGLPTLQRTTIREDIGRLAALTIEKEVGLLLMGKPLHMSGHEGRQVEYAREFAARLQAATNLPVEFWDERLTTVEAQRVLKESGISIEKRARAVDQLSAVILLESYLDSKRQDLIPE